MQNLCISRMESALIGNLQWNLILIQDLDAPTRLPVLCTENFFFFLNEAECFYRAYLGWFQPRRFLLSSAFC